MRAFGAKSAYDTLKFWSALKYSTPVVDLVISLSLNPCQAIYDTLTLSSGVLLAPIIHFSPRAMVGSQYVMCRYPALVVYSPSPLLKFIQLYTLLLNLVRTEHTIPASSTLQEPNHAVDVAQGLQSAVLGILNVVFQLDKQVEDGVVAD